MTTKIKLSTKDKLAALARELLDTFTSLPPCSLVVYDTDTEADVARLTRALERQRLEGAIEAAEYAIDVFWREHEVLDDDMREYPEWLRKRLTALDADDGPPSADAGASI